MSSLRFEKSPVKGAINANTFTNKQLQANFASDNSKIVTSPKKYYGSRNSKKHRHRKQKLESKSPSKSTTTRTPPRMKVSSSNNNGNEKIHLQHYLHVEQEFPKQYQNTNKTKVTASSIFDYLKNNDNNDGENQLQQKQDSMLGIHGIHGIHKTSMTPSENYQVSTPFDYIDYFNNKNDNNNKFGNNGGINLNEMNIAPNKGKLESTWNVKDVSVNGSVGRQKQQEGCDDKEKRVLRSLQNVNTNGEDIKNDADIDKDGNYYNANTAKTTTTTTTTGRTKAATMNDKSGNTAYGISTKYGQLNGAGSATLFSSTPVIHNGAPSPLRNQVKMNHGRSVGGVRTNGIRNIYQSRRDGIHETMIKQFEQKMHKMNEKFKQLQHAYNKLQKQNEYLQEKQEKQATINGLHFGHTTPKQACKHCVLIKNIPADCGEYELRKVISNVSTSPYDNSIIIKIFDGNDNESKDAMVWFSTTHCADLALIVPLTLRHKPLIILPLPTEVVEDRTTSGLKFTLKQMECQIIGLLNLINESSCMVNDIMEYFEHDEYTQCIKIYELLLTNKLKLIKTSMKQIEKENRKAENCKIKSVQAEEAQMEWYMKMFYYKTKIENELENIHVSMILIKEDLWRVALEEKNDTDTDRKDMINMLQHLEDVYEKEKQKHRNQDSSGNWSVETMIITTPKDDETIETKVENTVENENEDDGDDDNDDDDDNDEHVDDKHDETKRKVEFKYETTQNSRMSTIDDPLIPTTMDLYKENDDENDGDDSDESDISDISDEITYEDSITRIQNVFDSIVREINKHQRKDKNDYNNNSNNNNSNNGSRILKKREMKGVVTESMCVVNAVYTNDDIGNEASFYGLSKNIGRDIYNQIDNKELSKIGTNDSNDIHNEINGINEINEIQESFDTENKTNEISVTNNINRNSNITSKHNNNNATQSEHEALSSTIENVASIKSSDYDLFPTTNDGHISDGSGTRGGGGGGGGGTNGSPLNASSHLSPCVNLAGGNTSVESIRGAQKGINNANQSVHVVTTKKQALSLTIKNVASIKSSDSDSFPTTNDGHTSGSSGTRGGGTTISHSSQTVNVETICGEQKGINAIITMDSQQGERENKCSKHDFVTSGRPKKALLNSYKLRRLNEQSRANLHQRQHTQTGENKNGARDAKMKYEI